MPSTHANPGKNTAANLETATRGQKGDPTVLEELEKNRGLEGFSRKEVLSSALQLRIFSLNPGLFSFLDGATKTLPRILFINPGWGADNSDEEERSERFEKIYLGFQLFFFTAGMKLGTKTTLFETRYRA